MSFRRFLWTSSLRLVLAMCVSASAWAQVCSAPGKDGPTSISGLVNTYYEPTPNGTYGPAATSLSLINARGASTPITPGDLVMVMQMQCATLTTTNNANYGGNNGTGRGYTDPAATSCRAGQYEYVRAGPASSGTSLDLSTSRLVNTYIMDATTATNRRTFQVIRVPQYSSTTLSGTVTAALWNGSSGGVVVMDVAGNLNLGSSGIDVSGTGFRGAGGAVWANAASTTVDYVITTDITANRHAIKGEGIAGTPRLVYDAATNAVIDLGATWGGYAAGDQGRGAPGNAGGGGNNFNAQRDNGGGGGGANGGIGGFGAYGWNNAGWTTTYALELDLRGIGGGAFTQQAVGRLVMGGGGGAGANNNSPALTSSGGAGGGIVLVRAGSVSGVGTINANGSPGQTQAANDSGGGAGAGGSVAVIAATGNLAGLTVNATGGRGGDGFVPGDSAHAGGGGGAGGVVYTSAAASISVAGGANGNTNVVQNQPGGAAHGATSGAGGVSVTSISATPTGVLSGAVCPPVLTVSKRTTTPVLVLPAGTTAQYIINVSNASTAGTAYGVSISDVLPVPFGLTSPTATASVAFATATGPSPASNQSGNTSTAVFGVAGSANSPAVNAFTLPPGASVSLTFTVNVNNAPLTTYQNNASVTFSDPTRTTGGPATGSATINPTTTPGGTFANGGTVGGSNYASGSSTQEDVSLRATTTLSVSKTDGITSVTAGSTTSYTLTFSNTGGYAADNAVIKDAPGAGLQCTSVTCSSTTGAASCPVGLPLNVVTPSASVPNFFNATGIAIPSFPAGSTVVLRVVCGVSATGQ